MDNKVKRLLIRTVDGNILLVDIVSEDTNFFYCKNVYLGVFSKTHRNKITQWRKDLYFGQQNNSDSDILISKTAVIAITQPNNITGAYIYEVPETWSDSEL